MAQRYITSGRRYKEPQGLAPIINPYYAKRALQAKEPTLDNIAVTDAAVLDEAPQLPEADIPGMPENVGFQGADTGKPLTSKDVVAGWGNPAMNSIKDIKDAVMSMNQSAVLAPLGTISALPFAVEAIGTPIARGYNINKSANELESLRPQAESLGYGFPDTFASSDTASKVAASPQEGVNKGMGVNSNFQMPATYTDTNVKARMIQDRYEKSQEKPILSMVEDLFNVGIKSMAKNPVEGYGLPPQKSFFSIDPNATFDPEHNARDRDVAETISRGRGAITGWGKEGMLQPSDLDPETNTYSSDAYSNANTNANALAASEQSAFDAQQNSLNQDSVGDLGNDATPSGMGAAVGDMW